MSKHKLTTIKSWSEDDRPREKLQALGEQSLSLSELLAILIGSGSQELNAVDLCKQILAHADHDLVKLSRYSLAELCEFKGIGTAKAVTIKAALEIGRRRQFVEARQKISKVGSSQEAYNLIKDRLKDLNVEEFWVILLSRANKVLDTRRISSGGTAATIVDAKIIFKTALEARANALILVHNHPSGNLKPSRADFQLTHKLVAAGKTLDLQVLDHLIVTPTAYYSFANEGQLEG